MSGQRTPGTESVENAFTVDVEDYFHVQAFASTIDRARWDGLTPRVEANTHRLLGLLQARRIRGTFFVLGWVAERFPGLVRAIAQAGHEVASHGMKHQLIYEQSPEVFRDETRRAKSVLENLVQRPILGYRAATYSITAQSLWALDILAEEGFRYDSSIFPMHHDNYGIPGAPTEPYRLTTPNGAQLIEFPISVLRWHGLTLPVGGGGYFRLFPYALTRWALRRINIARKPFVFYLHPWEIDAQQPRVAGASLKSRIRHYQNLSRCEPRLRRLLDDFTFTPLHYVLRQNGLL
jgi:polysaccharide deacetylase family protein (PEP-CTERM system associated)